MKRPHSSMWIAPLVAAFVLTASAAGAQSNDLAAARDLYASAAYDEALSVLSRLKADSPSDARAIAQYRAFCLLALGKAGDAQQAIEAVVSADPNYHPSDNEASPRVRSAFSEVRRRMLPSIIQQRYAEAKAAYDRKDWATAAAGFSLVLITLADADVGAEANRPPLADIRTLSVGFQELSAKAATPLPPPVVPAIAPAAPIAPTFAPTRIFTIDDKAVVAPGIINQALPSFRGISPVQRIGRIEIVIDETGAVESAVMSQSVTAAYDKVAVNAARSWRYTPALLNGKPVKFKKIVQITLKPTT